jgi:hypothetical protein
MRVSRAQARVSIPSVFNTPIGYQEFVNHDVTPRRAGPAWIVAEGGTPSQRAPLLRVLQTEARPNQTAAKTARGLHGLGPQRRRDVLTREVALRRVVGASC